MANVYDSLYTGQHNDNYETRIYGLEGKATTFTAQITTHTNQISILQNSTTAIATTANSKLSLSGGNITGNINIRDSRITATGVINSNTASLTSYGFGIQSTTNPITMGRFDTYYTSTFNGARLYSQRTNSSGTAVYNILQVGFDNNCNRKILVSDAKAWRTALGLEDRVYCYVYYAASGDVSFSTWVKFNTVVSDTKSAYNTSTGQFTVPSAGYYLCNFGYYSNTTSANTTHRPAIGLLNSDGTTKDFVMGMGNISTSISHIWYCQAGEKLVAGTYNSSWSISFYASKNHNYFSILKL